LLIHLLVIDVTNTQQISDAVKTVVQLLTEKGLYLYGIVNNAGLSTPTALEVQPESKLQYMFDGTLADTSTRPIISNALSIFSQCDWSLQSFQRFLAFTSSNQSQPSID